MFYKQAVFNVPDESKKYASSIGKEILKIRDKFKKGELEPLTIAFKKDDLEEIIRKAEKITKNFRKVVLMGMGGSSLGAKTFSSLSKKRNYILFLDSLDPQTVERKLEEINLEKTFFISISKSGETIETICHTIMVINLLQKSNLNIKKHFLFITENNKTNTLQKIASKFDIQIMCHPNGVGGRYSYLSIVGLLPAALLGLDITKIREGAKKTIEKTLFNGKRSFISEALEMQLYLFNDNVSMNIMMCYIDDLTYLVDWYRQLLAESIGKGGFGITPVNAMGTRDQHSQLQLYLDGPKDKFFTFLVMEEYKKNVKLDTSFVEDIRYAIDGKYISEVLTIEQESTIEAMKSKNLPLRVIRFEKLNEESLSSLMMQMFLETIIICYTKKIDPFSQPAIELRKNIAKKKLLKPFK